MARRSHEPEPDGSTIARITVCDELPPGVAVDGYVPPEDRGPWRPASA